MNVTKETHLKMYRDMLRIRRFEETSIDLFTNGELAGFLHPYIGEEACAVGICTALKPDDYITSTHRGHGHIIAKGARFDKMMAELYGKATGYCHGKGGSMHIMDRNLGILGANGIVGGGIPIATGAALSSKKRNSHQVAVSFFGDGASDEGSFHESLNLASLHKLPAIYVCESNQYAQSQPQHSHQNVDNVAVRAEAYNMKSYIADGADILDVYEKAQEAADFCRKGEGPVLFEVQMYRWTGHYIGDPAEYRPSSEVKYEKEFRDPIKNYRTYLLENNITDQAELDEILKEINEELEEAVEFARNSEEPGLDTLLEDVFGNE